MRTIVVPVNFSPNSINAARYAADMARTIGAKISLINVLEPPVTLLEPPLPKYAFEEMRDANYDQLTSLSTELLKRTDNQIKISTALEIGGVENKLESFCRNDNTFLVVTGASGERPQKIMPGSAALMALRHLPYPLLVIPANVPFKKVKKIVLACDKEDIDSGMPLILPFLKEMSDLLGARLEVVHVLEHDKETMEQGVLEYNVWKQNLNTLGPKIHFVRQPKVAQGINDYLQTLAADWLMIFPKYHALLEFHKSRAQQITLQCPLPIISIHE
jgi:nucleotide-binding universal stress UspA family protein